MAYYSSDPGGDACGCSCGCLILIAVLLLILASAGGFWMAPKLIWDEGTYACQPVNDGFLRMQCEKVAER